MAVSSNMGVRDAKRMAGDEMLKVELVESDPVSSFTERLRASDTAMRALAFRLVGDRVAMDDVLQTAYLKAYRGYEDFRGDAQFTSWLYSIVYRACIDHLRVRSRRDESPLVADDALVDSGSDPSVGAADRLSIEEALSTLTVEQRAAVWLVDGEGHTFAQAAEILDISPGTAASRVSRARAALRETLGSPTSETEVST